MQKDNLAWLDCLKREGIRRKLDHRLGVSYHDMTQKQKDIIEIDQKQKRDLVKSPYDPELLKKTKIAVLGHSVSQFDNIWHQPYMEYFLLQNLDLGKFSRFQSNEYSESRAYLCDLFDDSEYVGVVSASWNSKYSGECIDNFPNWENVSYLYNYPNVILCGHAAHLECESMFRLFEEDFSKEFVAYISSFTGPVIGFGIWANQIICHRSIYMKLQEFHRKMIPLICDKEWPLTIVKDKRVLFQHRAIGLLLEAATNMWVASQPFVVLENASVKEKWYG